MKKLLISLLVISMGTPMLASASAGCPPLLGGGSSNQEENESRDTNGAAAPLTPGECSTLTLATPLYGNLNIGTALGVGAAVVAIGLAASNNGDGDHHGTPGTTGTTGTTGTAGR
ncbi:hypothetical protein D3C78_1004380 [compost metagenome]